MAKISNTSIYPNIDPVLSDYFVVTDANTDLATKTCTLESLQKLYNVDVTSQTIAVSSVFLNVLATQDFQLLPAPGSAYVYDIQRILVFMDPGSIEYNFSTDLPTILWNTSTVDITLATMNSTVDYVAQVYTGGGAQLVPINTALTLSKGGSNPTQGNGTLYINITYRTLKLDSTF